MFKQELNVTHDTRTPEQRIADQRASQDHEKNWKSAVDAVDGANNDQRMANIVAASIAGAKNGEASKPITEDYNKPTTLEALKAEQLGDPNPHHQLDFPKNIPRVRPDIIPKDMGR